MTGIRTGKPSRVANTSDTVSSTNIALPFGSRILADAHSPPGDIPPILASIPMPADARTVEW